MKNEVKNETLVILSLMGVFWLYRLFVLFHAPYDLYFDESYYYNWAKHMDWGYYSKPPMLSALIYVTTGLFGESQVALKIGAMLLYPVTTFVIYLIALELFDKRVAIYSALVFFTLPSVWLSSMIISTDVVLLLFWALALLFFIKALYHDKAVYWVLAGAASGGGLMSKYNFIFFLISVFLVLVLIPKYRKHFKNPSLYLSMFIALVIFLPNLIWNYQHDFVSFVHTSEISKVSETLIHPAKFFEFIGAQFGVFGPILFFFFWVIIFKRAFLKDERYLILFLFAIVTLGIIMILSFLSRSYANWAASTYVSATILVVAYLMHTHQEKLLKVSVGIHTVLAVLFFHWHAVLGVAGVELTRKIDPYARVSAWHDVADKISPIYAEYPEMLLLTDGRSEVAQFDYYMKQKFYIFNPEHKMKNQYHITRDLNGQKGKNFFFVSDGDIQDEMMLQYFESIKQVGAVSASPYPDLNRSYQLYILKHFKGY
jgi:4-amino-4-deoxy-L-arabinose transferase-like glycosyltransferase